MPPSRCQGPPVILPLGSYLPWVIFVLPSFGGLPILHSKRSLPCTVLNFFCSDVKFFNSNLRMVVLGMLAPSFVWLHSGLDSNAPICSFGSFGGGFYTVTVGSPDSGKQQRKAFINATEASVLLYLIFGIMSSYVSISTFATKQGSG